MRRATTGLLLIGVLALLLSPAEAAVYTFNAVTANDVADVATGEAQLFVDVTDAGGGQTLFTFFNTGPLASSITDVYFDDGSLLGIAGLIDDDDGVGGDPGVDFSPAAAPPNLPGGNNAVPPFVTTAGFSADSDPPTRPNGVDPGESLGILFDLLPGMTFANVEDDLLLGDLRIGIHVQGFDGGGSESYVNGGIVPEPASVLVWGLLATAFAAAAWRRRRRK